jgi:hypothetical protein
MKAVIRGRVPARIDPPAVPIAAFRSSARWAAVLLANTDARS